MYMHIYILNSIRHVINQVRATKPLTKKAKKDLSDDVISLSDSESEKPLKATSKAAAVSIRYLNTGSMKCSSDSSYCCLLSDKIGHVWLQC